MRIGIFTDTYYPELNGVANSAYLLKQELERCGHDVFVFTVTNPEAVEPENNVFRIRSIACPLIKERRMSYGFYRKWYRFISSLRLDIIHTQTEFSIGHLGRKASRMFGIPLIHTYHTIYEDYTHYFRIPGNEKLKGLVRRISKYICNKADTIIVPTEKVRRLVAAYGIKRPIRIQPTGTPIDKFRSVDEELVKTLKARYSLNSGEHVLISIGRLSHEKNLAELISMMKALTEVDEGARLIIVGDGPERPLLEKMVRELRLEGVVRLIGQAPYEQIQDYYAMGDIFVCASNSETQGLTYIEAMAAGKPLLVRSDECLEGVLEQERNGYGYETTEEFIDYYRRIINSGHYTDMVESARKKAGELSVEVFGANIVNIYNSEIKAGAL